MSAPRHRAVAQPRRPRDHTAIAAAILIAGCSVASVAVNGRVSTPAPTPYVRHTYIIPEPFFEKFWWVGFIIMFAGFLLIVLMLYSLVQWHFREAGQRRRRKEIKNGEGQSRTLDRGADTDGASVQAEGGFCEGDDGEDGEEREGHVVERARRSRGGGMSDQNNPLRSRC